MTTSADELFGDAHIAKYEETDGEVGYDWRGTTILILHTKGRKTGEARANALIFGAWEDKYLIVASKGGAPKPPAWYLNLQANPEDIEIQVKAERFKVHARDASEAEKPELWARMVKEWPAYDEYQEKTDRSIPVVVLERA